MLIYLLCEIMQLSLRLISKEITRAEQESSMNMFSPPKVYSTIIYGVPCPPKNTLVPIEDTNFGF